MKAAVMDLDGTLLDSIGMWDDVDREFLYVNRGIPVPEDYPAAIAHLSPAETAEYTIKRFSLTDSPEALIKEWDSLAEHRYRFELELMPYAREFLENARQKGIKLILCTGSAEKYYAPALKRLGVYSFFDGFVSPEIVGCGKATADIYIAAARLSGFSPEECTAFEDVPDAAVSAGKAGLKVCGVYEKRSAGFEGFMRKVCDFYVMNLKEAEMLL